MRADVEGLTAELDGLWEGRSRRHCKPFQDLYIGLLEAINGLRRRKSKALFPAPFLDGARRARTADLLIAKNERLAAPGPLIPFG
jgi:hypothetical protein